MDLESKQEIWRFIQQRDDIYNNYWELRDMKARLFDWDGIEFIANHSTLREVADELGVMPYEYNVYSIFEDFILSHYDINGKNIVEVGGGVLARLAKRLSLKQESGTITVYDPRLDPTIEKTSRIIPISERFEGHTNDDDVDLLIGLHPCAGIYPFLRCANAENKDFILWTCEGGELLDDETVEGRVRYIIGSAKDLSTPEKPVIVEKVKRFSIFPIVYKI